MTSPHRTLPDETRHGGPAPERLHQGPVDVPGLAIAEGTVVLLDGPLGIAVTMTPEAAMQTGLRLQRAAQAAAARAAGEDSGSEAARQRR